MKLHLPIGLFRAIMTLLISANAFAQTTTETFSSATEKEVSDNPVPVDSSTSDVVIENHIINKNVTSGSWMTIKGGAIQEAASTEYRGHKIVNVNGNGITLLSSETGVESAWADAEPMGGAIYSNTLLFSENNSIKINDNFAEAKAIAHSSSSTDYADATAYAHSYGGSLYAEYTGISFTNNGNIELTNNHATAEADSYVSTDVFYYGERSEAYAYGGAVCSKSGDVIFNGNDAINISGNFASSVLKSATQGSGYSYAYGGAIYCEEQYGTSSVRGGTVKFTSNGQILIDGNYVENISDYNVNGGAVYCHQMYIQNNDSVIFEKNYRYQNGSVYLNSIFAYSKLVLSAAEGNKIEFRDGFQVGSYSAALSLNPDYVDENGETHIQTGDIILTGEYAAKHYNEIIAARGEGETVEALPAYFSVYGQTTLHNGTLKIIDGARFSGRGMVISPGAELFMRNGAINCTSYSSLSSGNKISFNDNSVLSLFETNSILAETLHFGSGVKLNFTLASTHSETAALTLSGEFSHSGETTIWVDVQSLPETYSTYKLIDFIAETPDWDEADTPDWDVDEIKLECSVSDNSKIAKLMWNDGCLVLCYGNRPVLQSATWTNASGDGQWTSSALNWTQDGVPYGYSDDVNIIFDNRAPGTIQLSGSISPKSVLVDSTYYYKWESPDGSGSLSGNMSLTKRGKGTLGIYTSNSYSGGTEILGGTVVAGTATALGSGTVSLTDATLQIAATGVSNSLITSGTSRITVLNGGSLTLLSAINNAETGILTLSGKVDVSTIGNLTMQEASYLDVNGNTGENGFACTKGYTIQVVNGGKVVATNAKLVHKDLPKGMSLILKENGLATAGATVDYTQYTMTDSHSVSVSKVQAASCSVLNNIVMKGGELTVDTSANVTATSGNITVTDDTTLSGTITNTHITFDQGNYSAHITADIKGDGALTINGGEVTLSGNNSYTGGTTLNGGSLMAGNASALGIGTVTVNDGTLALNNLLIGNNIVLNNGNLTGNTNYVGNLSIGGDNVTVEGGYTLSVGKVLEIAVGGTELDSDLTLSGGTLVFRGAPLTVDGEVSFSGDTNTLVDLRRWEGQLSNGQTLAIFGTNVSGWREGCLELIGISNMSLAFDDTTGALSLQRVEAAPVTKTITWQCGVWQTGRAGWMNATTGYDAVFESGSDVIFTQPGTVTIAGGVEPGAMIVAGGKDITFKSDKQNAGRIVGKGSLTKRGNGKLTLNDGNTYSGGTSIEAGTVTASGATSFGRGDITISGGTIDMKSKAVANDITLSDSAAVKGGKKYLGTYTQTGGELMKGSVLNVAESATISGGVVNGTLSGVGTVTIDGEVELGVSGKLTTAGLSLTEDAQLTVSTKGLVMSSKTSVIDIQGGSLASEGKISAASLQMNGGDIEVRAAKAQSLSLNNKLATNSLYGANIHLGGKMSVAGNLVIDGVSQLHLFDPGTRNKAQSLAVKGSLDFGGGSSLRLNGALSAKDLTLGSGTLTLCGAKLSSIKVGNSLTLNGGTTLNLGFNVTEKDKGKAFKVFTFKTIDESITPAALNELLGLGTDAATLAFDSKRKAITLTVTDAAAWNAYAESVRNGTWTATPGEDDELVESAGAFVLARPAAAVDPLMGKVADTLVQSTWGTAGASRAFGDTIAARGTHATALADGKAAAWISTMGGSSRISSDGTHAGADYTLTGVAFGVETRLGEKSTVGLAIGNSWGKVSTFSAFPVDQDSTHQGIYGKHMLGSSTTLSWMAAHTRTEGDGNLAGMACDWTQDALQLDASVDKLFAISDRTTVSAFVGMQYLATDKGECNGLSTGSLQNLRGEIGVSAGHKATDKAYIYGELSFVGDMVRHNPTAPVGDYRSRGANPGRAGLNLSVGTSYQLNDSWSLNGSYRLELMQNQTSHSANVGATYSF